VPPARIGTRPRARIAAIAPRASAQKRAAEYASVGPMRSIRWCATRARVAASGFAVPMSMPR